MPRNYPFLFCFFGFLFVYQGVQAEPQFIRDFYETTGDFFDLKPYQTTHLPVYVSFGESFLVPGGGHVSNNHLSKATTAVVTSLMPLVFAFDQLDKAENVKNKHKEVDVHNWSDKYGYEVSRKYFFNTHQAHQFFFLGTLSFFDSLVESFILHGRGESDDTVWSIGANGRSSHYSSQATFADRAVNDYTGNYTNTTGTGTNAASKAVDGFAPGFFLGVETGRTTAKRVTYDFGLSSSRMSYEWWLGLPLHKLSVPRSLVTTKLGPALGIHWFQLKSRATDATTTTLNSSLNRFNLTAGNLWLGLVWNNGQRFRTAPHGTYSRLAAGVGTYLLNLGTVWSHPLDLRPTGDAAREGSAGLVSERAVKRGFFTTQGVHSWFNVAIWRNFSLLTEFDWLKAQEQGTAFDAEAASLSYWLVQSRLIAEF